MRSYVPRLPRRRTRWQKAGAKAGKLAAWSGIGFAAVAVANTDPGSGAGVYIAQLVFGGGALAIQYVPPLVRRGRTPERHRNPSRNSQPHNPSSRSLNRRFRRG